MALGADSLSRFQLTEAVNKDGKDTYGLWVRPTFMDQNNLQESEIITLNINQELAGRPDQISQRFYNTPFLEWVIIMFNRPQNTVGWPKAGTIIKIPTREVVMRNL